MGYDSIAWLPLTAGLTILGLVLSYLIYQRRGMRPALLGVSVSLLPIAAYLTGSIEMFWKIAAAIGAFGTGFVFSPAKWVGIGVTGLAVALFLAAGGRERRRASREARKAARANDRNAAEGASGAPALTAKKRTPDATSTALTKELRTPVPATRSSRGTSAKATKGGASPDDDMRDIEEILRKRGL